MQQKGDTICVKYCLGCRQNNCWAERQCLAQCSFCQRAVGDVPGREQGAAIHLDAAGSCCFPPHHRWSYQLICFRWILNSAQTWASPSWFDSKPHETSGTTCTDFGTRLASYFGIWGDGFSQANFCIGMSAQQGGREPRFFWHAIMHRKMGILDDWLKRAIL